MTDITSLDLDYISCPSPYTSPQIPESCSVYAAALGANCGKDPNKMNDASVVKEGSRSEGASLARGAAEGAKGNMQDRALLQWPKEPRNPVLPFPRLQIPDQVEKAGFLPSVFVFGPNQETATKREERISRTFFPPSSHS